MNKTNKLIVIALATLLLQSCASQLQISELQVYAQKTADVYEKSEFRRWDQLVKQKETKVARKKTSMIRNLRQQSNSYRALRAYLIMREDYSMFTIDEPYVDSSSQQNCLMPKDTDQGQKYLLESTWNEGQLSLTLVTSNRIRDLYKRGVSQRKVRVLTGTDIVEVLLKDVQNYIQCSERTSPGLDFGLQTDWRSLDSVEKAHSYLLMNALVRRALVLVTSSNWH